MNDRDSDFADELEDDWDEPTEESQRAGKQTRGPRPTEAALITAIEQCALEPARIRRALVTTAGGGQLAASLLDRGVSEVVGHCWDVFPRERLAAQFANRSGVRWECAPDFPIGECDLVALPLAASGDGELARDMLQQAHERLTIGGTLFVSTDNPRDQWLGELVESFFGRAVRTADRRTAVYRATKTASLKKLKDYACEFVFRDGERLIRLRTRPGVFSHRRLDLGARALLETAIVRPGMRIADIGCGSGGIAVACGLRAPGVHAFAVDSAPRAIEATEWAAKTNGLDRLTATLDASARIDAEGTCDLALANPPYYSRGRIAGLFLESAAASLKRGGRLLVVTKNPAWFVQRMTDDFKEIAATAVRSYQVVSGVRR